MLRFDYSHKNVPSLPSFLPAVATEFSIRRQSVYQKKYINGIEVKKPKPPYLYRGIRLSSPTIVLIIDYHFLLNSIVVQRSKQV